ncbi:hypothetical protein [Xenorhabdus bovienii]|uniref:hypothetical protein n=1 Tax=Xenorhabdus bovienii TaxID=40576 RepID=UPI0023B30233|nr:hypothetical protein [Xenorhabdus bovienii]MDE9537175.1 hypothetical protein [Xenorhabdus bovienii]MDE9590202.1 hypothetical protein [Xenorhabdus bovienii]
MAKHVHADLMIKAVEIAQLKADRWWEHFEVLHDDADRWCSLAGEFYFDPDKKYRLKPRTIKIGSVDVPEPVREPLEYGQLYFCPCVSNDETTSNSLLWTNHECDKLLLQRGLIHLDRESAVIHTKALISLTEK